MDIIYKFINKEGEVIYVGQTKNIKDRLMTHLRTNFICEECYKEIEVIEHSKIEDLYNPLYVERYFITKYNPKYNTKDYFDEFKENKEFEKMKWEVINYKDFLVDALLGRKYLKKEHKEIDASFGDLVFSKEIEYLISSNGIKKTWVAECMGITYNSLRRKLNGEIPWKKSEKESIIKIIKGD